MIDDIYKGIGTLNIADMFEKLAIVIAEAALQTIENGTVSMLRLVEVGLRAFRRILDAPWHIPVLSALYKDLTGSTLTLLDAVCLIAAIPGTLLYRIAAGETPFTAAEAKQLTGASSHPELIAHLTAFTVSEAAARGAMSSKIRFPSPTLSGRPAPLALQATAAAAGADREDDDEPRPTVVKATDVMAWALVGTRSVATAADFFKTFGNAKGELYGAGAKAAFDLVSFCVSLTTNTISLAEEPDAAERGISFGMTLIQVIFPIRDATFVAYQLASATDEIPAEDVKVDEAVKDVFEWIECGVGFVLASGIGFVYGLEVRDDPADATLKFVTNLQSMVRRLLAPAAQVVGAFISPEDPPAGKKENYPTRPGRWSPLRGRPRPFRAAQGTHSIHSTLLPIDSFSFLTFLCCFAGCSSTRQLPIPHACSATLTPP